MIAYKVYVLKTNSMYPHCTSVGFKCMGVVHSVGFRLGLVLVWVLHLLGTAACQAGIPHTWSPKCLSNIGLQFQKDK